MRSVLSEATATLREWAGEAIDLEVRYFGLARVVAVPSAR